MTALDFRSTSGNSSRSGGRFRLKDPISCLTHFAGFLLAALGTPFLLVHAVNDGKPASTIIALAIFMGSMMLLYLASASYHAVNSTPTINRILKKFDHMSICVLIAGSYTPVCTAVLPQPTGTILMIAVWVFALAGMIFKLFWVHCPKWVSSVMYISMGWVCIAVMPQLIRLMETGQFIWLAAGGVFYTVGGLIYSSKKKFIPENSIGFGNHELFHLFIMTGSLCHFIMMFRYIA
ncbi:MAG: hemolysin III family protein [Solobacterium sp.]|nr:hemolysin III family protein [Solobacterium sp.]